MLMPGLVSGGEFGQYRELFEQRFPQRRSVRSGEVAFGRRERGMGVCYYLLKGRVNGYLVHENGGSTELVLRSEDSCFPLYYSYEATAMEMVVEFIAVCDCELLVMPKHELRQMMLERPQIALAMLDAYGAFCTYIDYALSSNLFDPLETRMCDFLYLQRNARNEVHYTQAQIGEAIGASRPNVTRALKALEQEKIIGKRRGVVIVLDKKRLLDRCSYVIRQSTQ